MWSHRCRGWSAGRWTSKRRRSHLQRASDLELTVVDEPADRFQDRVLRLVARGVAELPARLVDAGVLAADQVLPAPLAVVRGGAAAELVPGHRVQVSLLAKPRGGDLGVAAHVQRRGGDDVEVLAGRLVALGHGF